MRLLHEIAIFQIVKSKVIMSLFETVKLSVSISPRNLYNSLNSIKEKVMIKNKGLNQSIFLIFQNILSDLKRQKGNAICTMDDVRGDVLRPPHGTTPAAEK